MIEPHIKIPSREDILSVLRAATGPLTREQVYESLKLTEEQVPVIERRIRAMERDGQLMPNRKGLLLLSTKLDFVAGRVIGHRDGFGSRRGKLSCKRRTGTTRRCSTATPRIRSRAGAAAGTQGDILINANSPWIGTCDCHHGTLGRARRTIRRAVAAPTGQRQAGPRVGDNFQTILADTPRGDDLEIAAVVIER